MLLFFHSSVHMLKMYIILSLLVVTIFQVVAGSELCSRNSKTLRYCDGSWYCCQSNTGCCSTTSFPYYAPTRTGDLCRDTVTHLYYCEEGYSCCRGGTSCCKDSGIGSSGSTRHDSDIDSSGNNTRRDLDMGSSGSTRQDSDIGSSGNNTRRDLDIGSSGSTRHDSDIDSSGNNTRRDSDIGSSGSTRHDSDIDSSGNNPSRDSDRVGSSYRIRGRGSGSMLTIYIILSVCWAVLSVISCICKCMKSTARTAGPGNDVIGRY